MESISPYVIPGIKFELMPKLDQEHKAEIIIEKISEYTLVPVSKIKNRHDRRLKYAVARQLAMYFVKTKTDLPLTEIGRIMGGFHHTSIIHSIVKVKGQISAKNDNMIKDYYYQLIKII